MNIKRIFLVVLLSFLAAVPISIWAQDTGTIKTVSGALECGNAVLNAQSTYYIVSHDMLMQDYFNQVLEERLTWRNTKTNQQRELKTDAKYVIKHVPEKRRVLDAALRGWSCKKSKQGKYYFWLFYSCTLGEEKGFCAQGQVEFGRYLNEDGTRLIKKRRRWAYRDSDLALYKSLGLEEESAEVRFESYPNE